MSDHPPRCEQMELEERRIVKAFVLQQTSVMTLPSRTGEEMVLLSLLSWGGESVDWAIRFPVLKELRAAIDGLLPNVEVI